MFWISSRQRYQNEVSLPGPRCPLHICIDVLRQTQSSHVPSQTPKYHKTPHSKSQPENAGICFLEFLEILVLYLVCIGLYWFCLVVSGVSQSLRAGRLKMMSTKKRCEENHRPRIGKQRRKKTLESKGL